MKLSDIASRVMAWRPMRVITHYSNSGGGILAGGMSYQSIFAVFAAIWVGFSIAGLWLNSNPALTRELFDLINQSIPGLIGSDGIIDPSELATAGVLSWTGAIALVGLLATALGWLSTTATAVRIIFGMERDTTFFVLVKARELGLGLLFGLALVVSALVSLASTWALGAIFGLAGMSQDSFWFNASARTVGLLLVLVIDTATLAVLFRVLSRVRIPLRRLLSGSLLGAAALGGLKVLGGALLGGAGRNPLLATFAVIIGLLIWFNLMSTVTLLAAAWIAVGMEDAGIDPRRLGTAAAADAEVERARREAEAVRVGVLTELREASRAHKDAAWHQKLGTSRRLRAAVDRAAREGAAGPDSTAKR
ncbi:YihY/virulence factor BrkB family protein [Cryobacterium tagatosivorans]|uniref:YihY/virulence factor BrkB family protein n=1 Tax=Cryobacterium tagatosivorans TaxID=1259199 RepID=A0A4V3I6M4_9MICO|nr:YhjD/YihY/BrkB family envelope integrity protein [Cryobacterium tagatosivorans]TFB52341.1 YihY/virulence factor BrkB family protein [Cryobacterium tagatosivorans]